MDDQDRIFEDPSWEAFGLLMEAYRAVDTAMACDTYDASPYDRQVIDLLIRLARTPGSGLRAVDIARALTATPSQVTRVVDRAEEAGLVCRGADPDDRRAIRVTLTDEGTRAAGELAPEVLEACVRHVTDHLSDDERRTLEDLLRRLRDRATGYLAADG